MGLKRFKVIKEVVLDCETHVVVLGLPTEDAHARNQGITLLAQAEGVPVILFISYQ